MSHQTQADFFEERNKYVVLKKFSEGQCMNMARRSRAEIEVAEFQNVDPS
jgi:hypothetical protein